MTARETIQDFLGQKRLAIVGVSRQPKDFSRAVLREFQKHGYEVVAVNPRGGEIEGQPCFERVQDIRPPVDGALVMTAPAATDAVVHDCAEAGVKRVWLFRGGGHGAVTADAVRFCQDNGIAVIPGECPFMFLPGGAWFHRVHGFVKKITGSYPR